MIEDLARVVPFLKQLPLFAGMTEAQIEQIATRFGELRLEVGQPLFSRRNPEENFYIIYRGGLTVDPGTEKSDKAIKRLLAGTYFDEESVLAGYPDSATIIAAEQSELLALDSEGFFALVAEFPHIKPALARTAEARRIILQQKFDWIGESEVIYFLARKHEVFLIFGLIGPIIVFLITLGLTFFISSRDLSTQTFSIGMICSGSLALGAILWGVWSWLDWGNDFYIVTNQRVVWLEKVIWLYESRDEAPLNTILAVNKITKFLGRWLDFGDVLVKTFTGEIVLRNMRDPSQMVACIEEFRARMARRGKSLEKKQIDQSLRSRLRMPASEKPTETRPTTESPAPSTIESQLRHPFRHLFTMRYEEGNVITYRKYWPTFIGKVWQPTLALLLVLGLDGYLVWRYRSGLLQNSTLRMLVLLSLLILVALFLWWLYKFVDWRNDIYQVTDKFIFDIYRKPLGTESKQSAPLENILSMEHRRVGFLGYILNYGNVVINVGETRFIFMNVHEPARVQQDIFTRIHALRRQKEAVEAAQQREHLVDVIEIYHRDAEEFRQEAYSSEESDEIE